MVAVHNTTFPSALTVAVMTFISSLYPTYDVNQRYHQGNIGDVALWLVQYHDIALWYS